MEEKRNAPLLRNEDRISRLPDELIHNIMSFGDTKHAVQTSVLSKRWIDVWKSVPVLNFNRASFLKDHKNNHRFVDFVYMVLFRGKCDIQGFSLCWENISYDDMVHINTWIPVALKRNVQEVTISISQYYHSAYIVPHQLLNCKSLRKLTLAYKVPHNVGYANIVLPDSMSLPQLKLLSLNGCSISDTESFKRLISSCPSIKTLRLRDSDIQNTQWNLVVDSPSLEYFSYTNLRRDRGTPKFIELSAPKLKAFTYRFFLTQEYYLLNRSSPLSVVRFDVILQERRNDETFWKLPSVEKRAYANCMMRLLEAVNQVKTLHLSSGFLEVLSQAPELRNSRLSPRLCNLKHLTLEMWSTRGCLRAIAYILKISPNITSILIESKELNSADVGDDWEVGLSLPEMLSHLEYVQIEEVRGCDAELKLLSFLLKHGKVLQEVFLSFHSTIGSIDGELQEQFMEKLRAVPPANNLLAFS